MNEDIYPVRNRAEWIARLLYAPDEYDRTCQPLYGKTRLQKASFLLDRKLGERFDIETGFDFEPDKYGPFDKGIYTAIGYLENQGIVDAKEPGEHDEKYDLVCYDLTEEGCEWAREEFESLPEGQQEVVLWVKNKHAMKKLGRLLTYVYNEYPEMTVESELV